MAGKNTEVKNTEVKNEVAVKEEQTSAVAVQAIDFDIKDLGMSEDELAELTGLDAIDSSEIRIPFAILHQKDAKIDGNTVKKGYVQLPDGSFLDGFAGEKLENISILSVKPVRVYFPTPFDPKNDFICRSLDGKVGAEDGQYAGQSCSTCQYAKYPEGGGASPCRDQRLLLCSKEDGSLFHLQIGGVGVKEWKNFMSAQVFHLLPKVRQIFGALKVTLQVKETDTNFGIFAAIDFQIDPKDPFHTKERVMTNLNSLKSYKEFESDHLKSAAVATQIQMATGGEAEEAPSGPNNSAF